MKVFSVMAVLLGLGFGTSTWAQKSEKKLEPRESSEVKKLKLPPIDFKVPNPPQATTTLMESPISIPGFPGDGPVTIDPPVKELELGKSYCGFVPKEFDKSNPEAVAAFLSDRIAGTLNGTEVHLSSFEVKMGEINAEKKTVADCISSQTFYYLQYKGKLVVVPPASSSPNQACIRVESDDKAPVRRLGGRMVNLVYDGTLLHSCGAVYLSEWDEKMGSFLEARDFYTDGRKGAGKDDFHACVYQARSAFQQCQNRGSPKKGSSDQRPDSRKPKKSKSGTQKAE